MSSLNMLRKCVERQFCYYLVVFFIVLAILNSGAESKLAKYISWGEPCKIPRAGVNLKPNEKCDIGKGMECQIHWYQQAYCLCISEASNIESITYDRKSKECRLKVGQYCNYVNETTDAEEFHRQTFHDKCHEDAECLQETEKSEDETCICKHGFAPSSDGSECHFSTEVANATANKNVLCRLCVLTPLVVFSLRLLIYPS